MSKVLISLASIFICAPGCIKNPTELSSGDNSDVSIIAPVYTTAIISGEFKAVRKNK